MTSPPKKAPGAGEQTGRKLIASQQYAALALLANAFAAVLWFLEQHRSRHSDRIEKESSAE